MRAGDDSSRKTAARAGGPLSGVLEYAHAWSPDGHWLAVVRDAPYSCDDATSNYVCDNMQLWIVNAFNGRKRRILQLEGIHGLDWRQDKKLAHA